MTPTITLSYYRYQVPETISGETDADHDAILAGVRRGVQWLLPDAAFAIHDYHESGATEVSVEGVDDWEPFDTVVWAVICALAETQTWRAA